MNRAGSTDVAFGHRHPLWLAIAASVVFLAAGCGEASTTVAPVTTPTATAATPSPVAEVPVLGQLVGTFAHGRGFGQVKPTEIFNGGDPTGEVTNIVWAQWGGTQANGTGTSEWVGPGQIVANATQESATVVAFNPGTCDGKLMYRSVEWYFPQHGQSFDPSHYEDVCTGSYVPSP